MIPQSEMLTLLLGLAATLFLLVNHSVLERLPRWRLLLAGFYFFLAGWSAGIVEEVFARSALNAAEQTSTAAGSVLLAAWCCICLFRGKEHGAARSG